MNEVRLTRRGKFVATLLAIVIAVAFTYVTRDVCWTGTGYGSCIADLGVTP